LKGFLDSTVNSASNNGNTQPFGFSYIIVAAGLSCVVLAGWRWYVRYLDNYISKLYPEIMLYEQVLGMPFDAGIAGYLSSQKTIADVLPTLYRHQRQQLVKQLVKDRRVGRRGHLVFDVIVLVFISLFILLALIDIYSLHTYGSLPELVKWNVKNLPILASKWVGYVLIGAGLIIQIRTTFFCYQKNPSRGYMNKTLEKLKTDW